MGNMLKTKAAFAAFVASNNAKITVLERKVSKNGALIKVGAFINGVLSATYMGYAS